MSRLLMLLTMYRAGFDVGKYISIERIIEISKSTYYESLKQSSVNWHTNQNDYAPFIDYFLGVVLKAYQELSDRLNLVKKDKSNTVDLIIQALQQELRPLSKNDLVALIPQYSEVSIKRALAELRKQNRLELIGRGRASKYVLK